LPGILSAKEVAARSLSAVLCRRSRLRIAGLAKESE
jgi:hypothetical protein